MKEPTKKGKFAAIPLAIAIKAVPSKGKEKPKGKADSKSYDKKGMC